MINRDVPTMKHGGEAKTRGMGCAIKGGKFEGVFQFAFNIKNL